MFFPRITLPTRIQNTSHTLIDNSIREAKRLYYLRLFAIHKNDIQKTWIVINNTLNNNSRNSRQSEFIVNNNKLTDPEDIANAFNDYFINIGRQLSDKSQSPHHYSDYLHNQVESHLQLKPINEIDISTIINNLKNKTSYGHDEISNKLLKRAGPALIKSLTLMVNQMLFTGIFPDRLKISKVKPLFKAGNPVLISNYRPISLLPSLSKIFERIIFQQLFDYMTDNNLFARVGKKPGFFVINRKKPVFWFKPGFFGFYGFNGFYGFFSVCIFL